MLLCSFVPFFADKQNKKIIHAVIGNADHVKTTILPAVLPVVGAMHPKKQPEGVGTVVVEMVGTVATTVTVLAFACLPSRWWF